MTVTCVRLGCAGHSKIAASMVNASARVTPYLSLTVSPSSRGERSLRQGLNQRLDVWDANSCNHVVALSSLKRPIRPRSNIPETRSHQRIDQRIEESHGIFARLGASFID